MSDPVVPTVYGVPAWGIAPWAGIPFRRTHGPPDEELIGLVASRDLGSAPLVRDLTSARDPRDLIGIETSYTFVSAPQPRDLIGPIQPRDLRDGS